MAGGPGNRFGLNETRSTYFFLQRKEISISKLSANGIFAESRGRELFEATWSADYSEYRNEIKVAYNKIGIKIEWTGMEPKLVEHELQFYGLYLRACINNTFSSWVIVLEISYTRDL